MPGCPLEGDGDRAAVAVPARVQGLCLTLWSSWAGAGGHEQLMQQALGLPFILSPFKTLEMTELQHSQDVTARGEALAVKEQEPGNARGAQPGFGADHVPGWEGKVWDEAGPGEGLRTVLEADL